MLAWPPPLWVTLGKFLPSLGKWGGGWWLSHAALLQGQKAKKTLPGDPREHPSVGSFSVMSLTVPHQEATSALPRHEG